MMGLATEFANHMRERPTNAVLGVLAICVLGDLFIAGTKSDFMFTMGLFGALVLRALSDDPQPIVLTLIGALLSGLVLAFNHKVISDSGGWFLVSLLFCFLYALWEKIVNWFRL